MRYLVLAWHSPMLRDYRRCGWYDDQDAAWDRAAREWRNPRVRLALVIQVPDKPKRDLVAMIEADSVCAAPFTIPARLTGKERRIA